MKTDNVTQWLILANNDLKAADLLFISSRENLFTEIICFHCQQSVEKFLKAFLVFKNTDITKTHNLEILLNKCKEKEPLFPELRFGVLTSYNVSMRYPDEFRIPSIKEAKVSYKIAQSVKGIILSLVPIKDSDLTLF